MYYGSHGYDFSTIQYINLYGAQFQGYLLTALPPHPKAISISHAFKWRLKASMVFASLILSGILFQRNGPEAENPCSPKLVLNLFGARVMLEDDLVFLVCVRRDKDIYSEQRGLILLLAISTTESIH
jgi:hypothetical protein